MIKIELSVSNSSNFENKCVKLSQRCPMRHNNSVDTKVEHVQKVIDYFTTPFR